MVQEKCGPWPATVATGSADQLAAAATRLLESFRFRTTIIGTSKVEEHEQLSSALATAS